MGETPQLSLVIIIFGSSYLVILLILYALILPNAIALNTSQVINELGSTDTNLFSTLGHYFNNMITAFNILGIWNLLLFAPIIIAISFIGASMLWPSWL